MKLTITKKKWIRAISWASLGLSLCLISYKIHESYQEQALVQQHSPVIRVPIVSRDKGLGTLDSPNKILVWHRGKRYTLLTGNRYFRNTASYQSIEVHFDPVRDIAVLKGADVSGPSILLLILFLMGLGVIGHAIYDFRSITKLQNKGLE